MQKYFSSISILLLITTLTASVSPLLIPKAEAVGTINNIIPSSTSVALLQCANQNGAITTALDKVFDGISNTTFTFKAASEDAQAGTAETIIRNSIQGTGGSTRAVGKTGSTGAEPGGSSTVEAGLTFQELAAQERKIAQETQEEAQRRECLKSIGTAALHDLLAATTQDIVNWINTGFQGDPLFVQDQYLFFKGLANQEVYSFVDELNDPVKYPFGPEIGASIAATYDCDRYSDSDNNCFNNTAVFTLGTDIGENWENFYTDFNTGGWGGWLSATQNPANNPIDFQFIASQEIEARINAQKTAVEKEISDNGGFLSLRKCVLYDEGTAEQVLNGDLVSGYGGETYDASSFNYQYSYMGAIDNCKQYAVTTPGSVIADQLNIHLGASAQAVAMGDEINTSIAAIFDALTNQLINEGLASLDQENIVTQQIGGFGSNYIQTNDINASWYTDPYSEANLHTLLRCVSPADGTAINKCRTQIDITEDYLAALYEAKDILKNQTLNGLYLLDKNMPEPDIGWQERMQGVVLQKTNEINNLQSFDEINQKFITPVVAMVAMAANFIPPPVGQIIAAVVVVVHIAVTLIMNAIANSDEKVANSKEFAIALLNQRYENELKRIQWDIDNNNLPSAYDARLQRDKIPGYEETYDAYDLTISKQEQILTILKQIEKYLGPTEELTDGITDGTRSIASLRSTYESVAADIAQQGTIDEVLANKDLFESEIPITEELNSAILYELTLYPFGGLDYTVPDNLAHYHGEASIIADIAYAIADCTLSEKDQSGACPVDRNNTITEAPNGYNYSFGDGKKGKLEKYYPPGDDFYIVEHEWWSFAGTDVIGDTNAAGIPYTDDQRRMFAADTAEFLRLYPLGFIATSPRQNPYSIFYPFPIPPLLRSPWDYEKLYIHEGDDACLALKPIDLPYGTCYGIYPTLVYTYMNPTAFNVYDHVTPADKSVAKEIYLNYFIDAYRNPGYGY